MTDSQLAAKLAGARIAKIEYVSKNRKCGRTAGFVNCDIVRAAFRVLLLRHLRSNLRIRGCGLVGSNPT